MIKRVTIRLDTETDAQVVAALVRIPPGERNARICAILRREFGTQDGADLTQAVNRLAKALERHPALAGSDADEKTPKPSPLQVRLQDPAQKTVITHALLSGFESDAH